MNEQYTERKRERERERVTFVEEAIEGAEAGAVGRELVGVKSDDQPWRRRVVRVGTGRRGRWFITQFVVPLVTLVDRRIFQVQIQTHVIDASIHRVHMCRSELFS